MVFRKNLKEFLAFGSSNLIASLIFGLFWLFLASLLDKSDYGQLGFLISIVNISTSISLLGLNQTLLVHESKKENIFPAALVLSSIISFASSIVVFVITQNLVVSLLILGLTVFYLISAALTGQQKYFKVSKYILLRAGLTTVLAFTLYQFLGINGIILGFFIPTMFIIFELSPLIKNRKLEFDIFKTKIKFILFSYVGILAASFFRWGDKLIIGTFFGFSMLGSYYFAAQFLFLLEIIPATLLHYLLPQEAEGKKNKKIKIFAVLISCIVAIISISVVPYGVDTFLPNYHDSILPIQIMSIGIIPLSISAIQLTGFLAKEDSRTVLIGSVFQAGLYIILLVVLGQIWGLFGFAIGYLAAVTVRIVFNHIVSLDYTNKIKKI